MSTYFGMTGTPGTGKKTLAPLVASKLGVPCYDLNDLAYNYGLAARKGPETEVDAIELGRRVSGSVEGPCLLFGHLLPYAFGSRMFSKVVVLRCDPKALRRRLAKRGYAQSKIVENVEAELVGIVSADSAVAFGRDRVSEVDTTKASLPETAAAVAGLLRSANARSDPIDWISSYGSAAELKSLLGPRTRSGHQ